MANPVFTSRVRYVTALCLSHWRIHVLKQSSGEHIRLERRLTIVYCCNTTVVNVAGFINVTVGVGLTRSCLRYSEPKRNGSDRHAEARPSRSITAWGCRRLGDFSGVRLVMTSICAIIRSEPRWRDGENLAAVATFHIMRAAVSNPSALGGRRCAQPNTAGVIHET